ncbi:MAG: cell wall hydrolase [Sphingomonas bacterium]|nr:cell wall hydrolase [Sphingomonas bacterium]
MSFFQLAARFAAVLCMTAGVLGASSPGLASDYDRGLAAPAAPLLPTAPAAPLIVQPAPATTPAVLVDPVVAIAPRTSFASLAAAVAAHSAPGAAIDESIGDEHLRCLASAIYFESKGEPLHGQLAVAQVILNRTKSGRFASSVCGVIKQRGQFGFVRGGAIPAINATQAAYKTALGVAKVALTQTWQTEAAANALYFNGVRAGLPGLKRVATIGGHIFYR